MLSYWISVCYMKSPAAQKPLNRATTHLYAKYYNWAIRSSFPSRICSCMIVYLELTLSPTRTSTKCEVKFLLCDSATLKYVKRLLSHVPNESFVYQWLMTVLHYWLMIFAGGNRGRPDGAGHSFHSCVYSEGRTHGWVGSSRKGVGPPECQHFRSAVRDVNATD